MARVDSQRRQVLPGVLLLVVAAAAAVCCCWCCLIIAPNDWLVLQL
jgi:hypothetical protein